jgi:hypothetical protein
MGIPAKILTGNLPNSSKEHYYLNHLARSGDNNNNNNNNNNTRISDRLGMDWMIECIIHTRGNDR